MKVGSLFSGIGGLDLGLERAGMTVSWQSEIDPYACKVLAKHWPGVPNHGDIKRIDWGAVEPVDVICGGYPCQPFSTAGKRRGKDDPRHLWPWVRDAIGALRPNYAILENVRGHLSLGGLTVVGELAEIGYDAEWRVVSAAGMGAPHRRDRIIIVAYPNGCDAPNGRQNAGALANANSGRRIECDAQFRQLSVIDQDGAVVSDPKVQSMCGGSGAAEQIEAKYLAGEITSEERQAMRAGNGGKLNPMWVEWLMGFPIGWTDLED